MFTGIIESLSKLVGIESQGTNKRLTFESDLTPQLQIDQSLAHNGVCLTVVEINNNQYSVDVIEETLNRTTINKWENGDLINLERSMSSNSLFDGHLVQGHVDTTVHCSSIEQKDGSWVFTFEYEPKHASLLIPKGSICVNGTSLTIADLTERHFSVAIIPYTYDFTNIHQLQVGDQVNIEFDVIGKYINRILETRH